MVRESGIGNRESGIGNRKSRLRSASGSKRRFVCTHEVAHRTRPRSGSGVRSAKRRCLFAINDSKIKRDRPLRKV
ncbi:hypothetical protein DEF98_006465 [Xanthomonas vasicola]|nr:hypothetical protein DEF98_006465 [Xanthomonas vasicola]RJL97589.1 hypothetical protein DEF96_006745 [Xanthomonas vasicola]RJN03268.1 hypothetical protein DEF97_006915 [Xanthomonas vasicola]